MIISTNVSAGESVCGIPGATITWSSNFYI